MMDPEPEAILVRYLASEIEPKKERNPLALSFFLAKNSEPEAFFLFFLDEITGYSPEVAFTLNSKSNKLGLELSCHNSVRIDGHYKLSRQCDPI